MLKKLRKKKVAKRVWIVLAILIVPAFVLWGFGSAIRGPKESAYAGKIFGKKISALEFQDALEATQNQLIIQLGENFYQLEKYLDLPGRAWERLVLLYEAKRRKIKANDQEVRELIESYPFFQRSGKFNPRLYEETLNYFFRIQPRIFEEQTRQNLIVAKLYKAVTDDLNLTEDEIKKEYQRANEEASVDYIAGIPADFAKDITVLEQDLKDYFSSNSLQFKQPLSFNLEYVSFALENADEKTIKDKINKFLLRLKRTSDWVKVAKDFNLEIKKTGLFTQTGPIPGIGWSPEILNLIAKLKVGQVSPPIQMDKYAYILRLKEMQEPRIPDFETMQAQAKEAFIKDRAQKLAKAKIESCLKRLKEVSRINPRSIDFPKIANDFGLKSDATAPFKYGSYIEGIGQSDKFWLTAQELKENIGYSEIIDLPSGFYIIKLKSKTPVDKKRFEAEKIEFAKELLAQKKAESFNKFLQDLKSRAQGLNAKLP